MSKKIILFLPLLVLLLAPLVSADCTDLTKHYEADNYYPDEDYSSSAHAHAELDLSRIYGADCTDNPYKSYAKVRVSCDANTKAGDGPLYVYRLGQNADWDDAEEEINCGEYGCSGEDEDYTAGTHTINLRDEKGEMDSTFFVCYAYGENGGYWAWTWQGASFTGSRSVYESHVEKRCNNNDVYWYDSLGRKGDKYEECGSDSCGDWGSRYCENDKVKHKRTCYNRGCENSACYQRTEQETETLKTCDGRGTGDKYCSGDNIVKDVEVQECSDGGCKWERSNVKTVKRCNLACIDATCAKDGDSDGIYDRNDQCPETGDLGYGLKNNGCPNRDSDNDGVIDESDKCPDEAGSSSQGCPNFIEQIVHLFGFEGWIM